MNQWKTFNRNTSELINDKNYAVAWKDSNGDFSTAHLAYWNEYEERFFSLQHNDSFPIDVDVYMMLPQALE